MNPTGNGHGPAGNARPTRLLVVGAGVAGQSLVKEIQEHGLPVEPVAFLDDDPALIGRQVCGLKVHGGSEDLIEVAAKVRAQEVLLAIPSSGGGLIRRLVILCKRAGLPFKIVPGLRDIVLGDVHFSQISEVQPEHLLGRESVDFRDAAARELVTGRTVMVTGAGGTIGGELCRQIIALSPAKLILLGRGENSIFEMAAELESIQQDTELVQVIADVRALLGIQLVTIGGSVGLAEGYITNVQRFLAEEPELFRPRVIPAQLGTGSALFGVTLQPAREN